ncbi:mechanosensitive ion channel protein MscS [Paenibacillus sp. J31TS4]|uniref:mechanosensitive ion channel family protein n=1 Tax=Paenibacillus sp. J31TS4 TaxID=2807195 RepID=UPI001B2A0EF9|nr:mechanosensitive ion channel family protein [Paenibacillus sp. J31TS4]GIP40631.1 mechanosensitive ion channel protein MscS [Paenibacillus sp. J31TS4]
MSVLTSRFLAELPTEAEIKSGVEEIKDTLFNSQMWINWGWIAVKIIILLIIGRIVSTLAQKMVHRLMASRERNPLRFDVRRTTTIGKLFGNVINYTINFILLMLILNQVGFNLGPLLAGAGVIGLAIGFGAQSLVKDVITGFFIIFEDQFAVGDVVQIGTAKGTVEEIGLRVTRIASWTGEVFIIPNGMIQQVTNFSIRNSVAVVDVTLAYNSDVDRAIELLRDAMVELDKQEDDIVKTPRVLGVQTMGTNDLVLRITAECRPNQQSKVSRAILFEAKRTLDRYRIEISKTEQTK